MIGLRFLVRMIRNPYPILPYGVNNLFQTHWRDVLVISER
jgi:hypothetical protein